MCAWHVKKGRISGVGGEEYKRYKWCFVELKMESDYFKKQR